MGGPCLRQNAGVRSGSSVSRHRNAIRSAPRIKRNVFQIRNVRFVFSSAGSDRNSDFQGTSLDAHESQKLFSSPLYQWTAPFGGQTPSLQEFGSVRQRFSHGPSEVAPILNFGYKTC